MSAEEEKVQSGLQEQSKRKDREAEIDYALSYTKFFLTVLGIWPLVSPTATKREETLAKIFMPCYTLAMFWIVLPVYLHLIYDDVSKDEFMILLGPMFHTGSDIIEHLTLVFHSDIIKFCVKKMAKDWRRIETEKDHEIQMTNLKMGRYLSFICAFGMYTSGFFYGVIKPFCTGTIVNELNQTIRPLVLPGNELIVDLDAGFNYELIFLSHIISAFLHYSVANAIFNLASIFVTHACGQIQIIIMAIENLPNEPDAADIKRQIALITKRHVSTLGFASAIERLLRHICLMEFFFSTVLICMLEYYLILELRNGNTVALISYSILLSSIIFSVFIYCYIGELLKEQCEQIGKAAYTMEWYRLPSKSRFAVIMYITASGNPRRLTAGRIIELSLVTFCNFIKSTFAYLGMLQTFVDG